MQLQPDGNGTCTQLHLGEFSSISTYGAVTFRSSKITVPYIDYSSESKRFSSYENFLLALIHCVLEYDSEEDPEGEYSYSTEYVNPLTGHHGEYNYPLRDLGFITATTSDKQKNAEKHLERFGFTRVIQVATVKYDGNISPDKLYAESVESKVSLWVMSAPELFFKLFPKGYKGTYDLKELLKEE